LFLGTFLPFYFPSQLFPYTSMLLLSLTITSE
jgi:hypothetical protein